MKDDNSSGLIGGGLGFTSSAGTAGFIYMCIDAVFQDQSGSASADMWEESSVGTDSISEIADGNYPALTTVLGLLSTFSGSSSAGPDIIIHTRMDNKKAYSSVEKKAKELYDKYNNNHIVENEEEVSLITESPKIADVVRDVICAAESKYELISGLETIENMLKENSKEISGVQYTKKRISNERKK